jgi:hypothetical protein
MTLRAQLVPRREKLTVSDSHSDLGLRLRTHSSSSSTWTAIAEVARASRRVLPQQLLDHRRVVNVRISEGVFEHATAAFQLIGRSYEDLTVGESVSRLGSSRSRRSLLQIPLEFETAG